MKKINIIKTSLLGGILALALTSCGDFLGTIPKGEKVPQTYEDYNAFIRYYENHYLDNMQQLCLMNDFFKTESSLNSQELARINYMWDETADRKTQDNQPMLSTNSAPYNYGYQAIAHWNLIVEDADKLTECTPAQQALIKAQAKVLRAMTYFHLTNYFAEQYTKENATTALSIPLIQSANVEATSPQVSLEEMYQFILADLTENTLNNLPLAGETVFHPSKGAGYAILARVYLQMGNYDNALKYAEEALKLNDKLYDWRSYYTQNKASYDDPANYSSNYPEITLSNPENYLFAFASMASYAYTTTSTFSIPIERAAKFEAGDLRLITKWKFRAYSTGDRYTGIRGDKFNGGGLSTPEMYYIKAECLVRKNNDIKGAMELVNKVRATRIKAENYQPFSATTPEEAISLICKDKANEYLQTAIPFWDMRRLNKETKFAVTLTKEVNGKTYSLKPDSHLWIMPFSESIMANPGNSALQQNTPR